MAVKITGKSRKANPARTVSVKLRRAEIVRVKQKAKTLQQTPHAFMRGAILAAAA